MAQASFSLVFDQIHLVSRPQFIRRRTAGA